MADRQECYLTGTIAKGRGLNPKLLI